MAPGKKAPGKKTSGKKTSGNKSRNSKGNTGSKGNPKSSSQRIARKPGGLAQPEVSDTTRWTFFSNHAHVLICLYQDSEMVLRDIASRVGITERAVQRIIQDLENAGHVQRERVGRCNHYHVIHDKQLRHPIEEHCTVDMLFDVILKNA